jgi:hypothetical protein
MPLSVERASQDSASFFMRAWRRPRGVASSAPTVRQRVFSNVWQRRSALFLLIAYCLDLGWKLADWRESFSAVAWWVVALGLTVRFAFMGFLLFLYLWLKKAPQASPIVTKAIKSASLRSMRIIYIVLLTAIVSYVFLAERILRPATKEPPAAFVQGISICAVAMVVIAFAFRRKLLPSAVQGEAGDITALGRWRTANLKSMILAVSVSLFGFVLRFMGSSRRVAWPFFIVSVVLMLLWWPRLDERLSEKVALPPPSN